MNKKRGKYGVEKSLVDEDRRRGKGSEERVAKACLREYYNNNNNNNNKADQCC